MFQAVMRTKARNLSSLAKQKQKSLFSVSELAEDIVVFEVHWLETVFELSRYRVKAYKQIGEQLTSFFRII